MEETEHALISDVRQRIPGAFDTLMKHYTKPVYYLVYRILNLGNAKEDLEECVSDVFVEAWQRIEEYDPEKGSLQSWLLMLAKYQALTYKRNLTKHQNRYLADDNAHPPELPDRRTPMLDREAQLLLLGELDKFKTLDRRIFIRRYLLNESIGSLAADLGLTRSAIENRLSRCKKRIKEVLS